MRLRPFLFIFSLMLLPASANAEILFEDNFDSYANISQTSSNGWSSYIGDRVAMVSPGYGGAGNSIQWTYIASEYDPDTTTPLHAFSRPIASLNLAEFYVQAKVKFSANPVGACKGIKFFGGGYESLGQYANSTFNFGPVASTPTYYPNVSFGDGDTLYNDTNTTIFLDGTINNNPEAVDPTVNYSTSLFYPDTNWHVLEVYMKYNTNGNYDGAYMVWIDGVLRLDVSGVRNRNDGNLRYVEKMTLGNAGNAYSEFILWMDDIKIANSYVGEGAQDIVPPASPSGLSVV